MKPGRISSFSFASRVLEGNPLRDPVTRNVWTWEPPTAGGGPLPILYGLAGFTGTGGMLLQDAPWNPGLGCRLDRLYHEGKIPPVIVALPDCFTRLGGSQYLNSSATGRYRDYFCDEVLPETESRLPVYRDREHRGLFGKSSGGFGAISLAMDRPDLFSAVACQSGDMGFEYCYLPDFPAAIAKIEEHGGIDGLLKAFAAAKKIDGEWIKVMGVLAMSACYSPDPSRSGYFELPFEVSSGKIIETVWSRWLRLDPVRRVHEMVPALTSVNNLFVDCGKHDEFNLHLGARMLHTAMTTHDIPHVYEEFEDGHMGISYRYERSIEFLARAVA